MRIAAHLLASCVLCAPLFLLAQNGRQPAKADDDWANLTAQRESVAKAKPNAGPKSPQQVKADKNQRADDLRGIAQLAKDFYTRYPNHPNSASAKKIEALADVESIVDASPAQMTAALKTARDYRNNKGNPASSRFEVAHAVERQHLSLKLGGKHWLDNTIEAEAMADGLHAEFGELPEVYGMYLQIAESGSGDNSGYVALKIIQSPAPPEIKAAARRVLERWSMLGRFLDVPLTTSDNRSVTLGQLAGKRTVLFVWSAENDASGAETLRRFQKQAPADTKWILVSFGTAPTPTKGAAAVHATPVAGTYCVEPLGQKSPLFDRLKLSQLPCAFVLDDQKKLVGFGRVNELPALIARAASKSAGGEP